MHFKVELCFELVIRLSKVLIPFPLKCGQPQWGRKVGLEAGETEGRGPVVPVGTADPRFHGNKGNPS